MQPGVEVPRALGSTTGPLCAVHDLVLLDLDGVVYAGPDAIPGAADHLAACRDAGSRLGLHHQQCGPTTRCGGRAPSRPRRRRRRRRRGDVCQAAARLVAETVPAASAVLVVGGEGLVAALAEHDLTAVWSAQDDPAAVVQGLHPTVGWSLLAEGAYALAAGIPWVASNLDRTVPTDRGRAPGNGVLVDVLRSTSGREPQVAGKPGARPVRRGTATPRRLEPVMVGDRIDTDIVGASRAGMASLLVLTGCRRWPSSARPTAMSVPATSPRGWAAFWWTTRVTRVDDGWRCGRWHAGGPGGAVPSTVPRGCRRRPPTGRDRRRPGRRRGRRGLATMRRLRRPARRDREPGAAARPRPRLRRTVLVHQRPPTVPVTCGRPHRRRAGEGSPATERSGARSTSARPNAGCRP